MKTSFLCISAVPTSNPWRQTFYSAARALSHNRSLPSFTTLHSQATHTLTTLSTSQEEAFRCVFLFPVCQWSAKVSPRAAPARRSFVTITSAQNCGFVMVKEGTELPLLTFWIFCSNFGKPLNKNKQKKTFKKVSIWGTLFCPNLNHAFVDVDASGFGKWGTRRKSFSIPLSLLLSCGKASCCCGERPCSPRVLA